MENMYLQQRRRCSSLSARFGVELRVFMTYVIAKTLSRAPSLLPAMSDKELWQSFKVAAATDDPYADIPKSITDALNPGEIFAVQAGRLLQTSNLPEGDCGAEIIECAKALAATPPLDQREESSRDLVLSAMYVGETINILRTLKHPQTESVASWIFHNRRH